MAKFDFVAHIRRLPTQVEELDQEADVPIKHYRRLANDAFNLLAYVDRNLEHAKTHEAPRERHRRHLCRLVLIDLVEAFERFLKEVAAVCVDHVSPLVVDARFDAGFQTPKGSALAQHFAAKTWGRALCESLTWLDCGDANDRFRRILADPFSPGDFYVFPTSKAQNPASLLGRHELVSLIFQLRHSAVHNAGVVTESDAAKLRVLSREPVAAPRLLVPSRLDVYSVKLYLDQTAKLLNEEIAKRLSALLDTNTVSP